VQKFFIYEWSYMLTSVTLYPTLLASWTVWCPRHPCALLASVRTVFILLILPTASFYSTFSSVFAPLFCCCANFLFSTQLIYFSFLVLHVLCLMLTLWRPATFGDFQDKNTETHVALRGNFSGPVSGTDPLKVSKDAASLVVCIRKKIFWLVSAVFLWVTSKIEDL